MSLRTVAQEGELDIYGKIELATEGLTPEYVRAMSRTKENALVIAKYISAMKSETNLSDNYRRNIIKITSSLSLFSKNKPFKSMTREDNVLSYLDSLRKPESVDSMHKWIGTYNLYNTILTKFFRWLYSPDLPPKARPKPGVIENIYRLKRREISTYKPTDLWTEEDDSLFLKYCPAKRIRCYHAISRDSSCRPHEILKLRVKDVVFKLTPDKKQYAEILVNGKTGTRHIPLINSIPFVKDYLDHEHPQPGNPNAPLICGLGKSLGRAVSVSLMYTVYVDNYQREYFPKLLDSPNVLSEDKQKIRELLKKPWNPYVRRHTGLTQKSFMLKSHVLNQYAGWTQGSVMAQKYLHYFGNESSESILEAYGMVTAKTAKSDTLLKPKQCPQCCEPNKPDSRFCAKCRMVLTYDAYNETMEKQQEKDSEIQTLKEQMRSMQAIVASFVKLGNDEIDSIYVGDEGKIYETRMFDPVTKIRYESNAGHTYIGNLKQAIADEKNR